MNVELELASALSQIEERDTEILSLREVHAHVTSALSSVVIMAEVRD